MGSANETLRRMRPAELAETIACLRWNIDHAPASERAELEEDLSDALRVGRLREIAAMRRVQGRNEMRAR